MGVKKGEERRKMQTAIPVLVKEKREVTVKEERGAIVQQGAIQAKSVAASSRESWALVFKCLPNLSSLSTALFAIHFDIVIKKWKYKGNYDVRPEATVSLSATTTRLQPSA